jgi:hypothetical protein
LYAGNYRGLEWSQGERIYKVNPELGIVVEVEVCPCSNQYLVDNVLWVQEATTNHPVVKTTGPYEGKFTFTSHEAGDHSICLSTNYTSWFSHTHIRLYLDIVVGSTKPDVEQDRSHVSELAAKVRDLNQKLEEIRREQQYQREREANYRDLSEATNARAVWYSIAQIVVLVTTCAWQLRHLRVSLVQLSHTYSNETL